MVSLICIDMNYDQSHIVTGGEVWPENEFPQWLGGPREQRPRTS